MILVIRDALGYNVYVKHRYVFLLLPAVSAGCRPSTQQHSNTGSLTSGTQNSREAVRQEYLPHVTQGTQHNIQAETTAPHSQHSTRKDGTIEAAWERKTHTSSPHNTQNTRNGRQEHHTTQGTPQATQGRHKTASQGHRSTAAHQTLQHRGILLLATTVQQHWPGTAPPLQLRPWLVHRNALLSHHDRYN